MRKERPFEECRGIEHSFAFNRAEGYDIYASRTRCVRMLIELVSKGGASCWTSARRPTAKFR